MLISLKSRNYLVTVNYYSDFIEVDYMSTTTTKEGITNSEGILQDTEYQRMLSGLPVDIINFAFNQSLLLFRTRSTRRIVSTRKLLSARNRPVLNGSFPLAFS